MQGRLVSDDATRLRVSDARNQGFGFLLLDFLAFVSFSTHRRVQIQLDNFLLAIAAPC
jgi:hypothetical protein